MARIKAEGVAPAGERQRRRARAFFLGTDERLITPSVPKSLSPLLFPRASGALIRLYPCNPISSVPKSRCFCLFARRATLFAVIPEIRRSSVPKAFRRCFSPAPAGPSFAFIRVIRFSSVPKSRCFCLFAAGRPCFAVIPEIRRSSVPKSLSPLLFPRASGALIRLHPCNQTFIRAKIALALRRMPFLPAGQPLLPLSV